MTPTYISIVLEQPSVTRIRNYSVELPRMREFVSMMANSLVYINTKTVLLLKPSGIREAMSLILTTPFGSMLDDVVPELRSGLMQIKHSLYLAEARKLMTRSGEKLGAGKQYGNTNSGSIKSTDNDPKSSS